MVKGFSILTSVAVCGAALAVFSGNTETQSVDVQRLRNRGQATYEEKQYADAVRAFTEVLSDASATPQDRLNLAIAQYRDGDDQVAIQTLEEAGGLLDDHPGASYLRGLIARRTNTLEEARSTLERQFVTTLVLCMYSVVHRIWHWLNSRLLRQWDSTLPYSITLVRFTNTSRFF